MGFLTPLMLWGAAAAGIPVAIHFFFRSRYRTVPWAAMKFLLTGVEQTSRRLKFQELLLLLLRMAVLVALALAFARPISSLVRGAGRGDAVDAVFVIDTSYSMGAKDGTQSRLDKAKDEALKIIDELPPQSTVQIITSADRSRTLLGPRSPANLDQARLLVQGLDITHLATDLQGGITEAQEVLARGQASNKEIYLFSDMQKLGWDQHAAELKSTLREIQEKAVVHLVRCGTRAVKNVAVVGITPQSGIPRPGERVGVAVLVRNSSPAAVENLQVSLAVDGDEKNLESTAIPLLSPGETRAVTLTGKLEKAGLRTLTAKVVQDDLDADNRFDQVILVRERVNILVVDGNYNEREPAKSSSFFLMHALMPVKEADRAAYHVQPRVVPARLAAPALLAKQDICILVNVPLQAGSGVRAAALPNDFVDALDPFVRQQGRGLIVFAGGNVQPDAYNKLLGKKHGLLPMPLKPAVKAAQTKPFLIDRTSFAMPSFWKFKDDDYYKDFAKVEVWQALQMDEGAATDKQKSAAGAALDSEEYPVSVILRLNDGRPIMAAKKVDAGEVIFVATAADAGDLDGKSLNPTWTDWPFRLGMFVPFIDVTINHLLHGQTHTYNHVAGQVLSWYPTDTRDNVYNLIHPDGTVSRLGQPEKVGKRLVVTASEISRAGIYRMTASQRGSESVGTIDTFHDKTGTPIAVIPDLRESEDLQTLSDVQLDEQLGFQPIHITAGDAAVASSGSDRLNREWTVWVLMAVLLLVLAETLLAWWCGRAW